MEDETVSKDNASR